MHEVKPRQDLEHVVLYALAGQVLPPIFCELIKIAVHVFKDHVQAVIFADDFLELHDVRVPQLAKRLDLTQRDAVVPGVVLALHALDGHHLPRLVVHGTHHLTVGTVSKPLRYRIAMHPVCGSRSRQGQSASERPEIDRGQRSPV